ncbi:hypothetical protein SANTM175S_09647 [Streptomyces antimycoticus]
MVNARRAHVGINSPNPANCMVRTATRSSPCPAATGRYREYDDARDAPRTRARHPCGGGRADSHPPDRRRGGEQPGQPGMVGPQRGRVPGRTRRLPGRRPVHMGPGGAGRGGRRAAGPGGGAQGARCAGGGRGRRTVRPLAGRPGGAAGGPGPLPPAAAARAADRRGGRRRGRRRRGRAGRGRAGAGRRHGPALPGRLVRPGVLGVRGGAVRGRAGTGDARGAPGAAAGRAVGLLGDASDPLGVSRRTGARGAVRRRLLLRPHALCGAGRVGPGRLRGAPPDAGRPGAGRGGRGLPAGRPDRTGMARVEPPGVGRLVPPAGEPHPGHGAIFVCERDSAGSGSR